MKTRFFTLIAGMAALFAACEKQPDQPTPEPEKPAVETYTREGVTPVTLSAGHETRTTLNGHQILWEQGDEISVLKEGKNDLSVWKSENLRMQMQPGEKKTILLVNPSRTGGFLGVHGKKSIFYRKGFENMGVEPESAMDNLMTLYEVAEELRNNTDYLFTLERINENEWLLYHKVSGIGLTDETEDRGDLATCFLGPELAPIDIWEGSQNMGDDNFVKGLSEQVYLRKVGGFCDGSYLWSGGQNEPLSWYRNDPQSDPWVSWLLFEDPGTAYPFTADSDGDVSAFVNTTGFEQGNDPWFGFYPASAMPTLTQEGDLFFHLPKVQAYQPKSFGNEANVSVGYLQDGSIHFRSVCGVLKLSIKGTQLVYSISVRDNAGNPLWGEAALSVSSILSGEDCSASVLAPEGEFSEGKDLVILDCGEGIELQRDQETDFYFVIPAGAFCEGFEIEIETSDGIFTKTTTRDNCIKRADIKAMPAFSLRTDPQELPDVSIENELVSAFMAYGPYSYFGQTSYFNNASIARLGNACNWIADKPEGLTISWDGNGAATITVNKDGQPWYTEDNLSGEYTITNLTPGSTYSFWVEENGQVLTDGTFKAVGQVRMVDIPDAWNCRDLGGWTGLDGHTIQYGKLFRTASLNGAFIGQEGSSASIANPDNYVFHAQNVIQRLGIQAELDLRGDPNYIPGRWGNDVSAHSASLLFTKIEGADFLRIMTDHGLVYPLQRSSLIQDVAWIIKELKQEKPVAFHCRIGADRTGALAFLIEGLLGVSEGDIARDYELTTLTSATTSFSSKKRFASEAKYNFFKDNGQGIFSMEGDNLQEKCYFYLNRFFSDVHIDADDLDWFICEMLGLDSYSHPSFARNYGMDLDQIISISTGSGSYNL